MARQLRIEYPGAFYHITSRGNEQKEISKTGSARRNSCHIGERPWAIWLKSEFILGFFDKKEKSAQHRYRVFLHKGYGALGLAYATLIAYVLHTAWQNAYLTAVLSRNGNALISQEARP